MRITLTAGVAALLTLLACGSDPSEETTADATTGAESNGGDKAGKGGASPEPGAAGASGTGAASAGKDASGTGAASAGRDASGTGVASAGKGVSGAGASAGGAGASSAGASSATAGASGATAGASGAPSAGASGGASSAKCDPSCPDGQRCELVQVTCIRAPCPPLPMCVAATSCEPAKILCKRAVPQCPEFQVPSVEGSCYGPCVPVDSCVCSNESQCPNHDSFTCHMSAGRCGPYV